MEFLVLPQTHHSKKTLQNIVNKTKLELILEISQHNSYYRTIYVFTTTPNMQLSRFRWISIDFKKDFFSCSFVISPQLPA